VTFLIANEAFDLVLGLVLVVAPVAVAVVGYSSGYLDDSAGCYYGPPLPEEVWCRVDMSGNPMSSVQLFLVWGAEAISVPGIPSTLALGGSLCPAPISSHAAWAVDVDAAWICVVGCG